MNPAQEHILAEAADLISELCNGTLDDIGLARLELLLLEEPAATRLYLEYADLHAELAENTPLPALAAALRSGEHAPHRPRHKAGLWPHSPAWVRMRRTAMAVCILLGLLLLTLQWIGASDGYAIERLQHGRLEERLVAVDRLAMSGSQRALETLVTYMRDEELAVARRAMLALGRRDWPRAIGHRATARLDPRPEIREAAMIAIGRHHRKHVDPGLILAALQNDPAAMVRTAAARAAGSILLWEAMPELSRALRDEDRSVRTAAADSVRRILGVDLGYRPEDSPEKREAAARHIESIWPTRYEHHIAWLKRLEAEARL